MVKLKKLKNGKNLRIYIEGESAVEIERCYYSFWNQNSTSEELVWVKPNLAYFLTTDLKFKLGLERSSLARILNEAPNAYKRRAGGGLASARLDAERRWLEVDEYEVEPKIKRETVTYEYGLTRELVSTDPQSD